jgi:pimeloyl-ACP methyl ester carboxylesterase
VGTEITEGCVTAAGARLSYLQAGPEDGPPLLLVHGLLSDKTTWDRVLPLLAERGLRVFALDLLGHGASDAPPGDYLLDDFAVSLRAFLDALGLSSVSICGHSLGGAIAIHFGFHYPAAVDRLVLVSAGGLGREVNLGLRLLSVRGVERAFALLLPPVRRVLRHRAAHRLLRWDADRVTNLRRMAHSVGTAALRGPFFASLRGVIAPRGQRGSFLEMRYLAEQVPTLLIWSERDGIIPVAHAHATQAHLPGSKLLVFPDGGHEPHRRHAEACAAAIADFVLTTWPEANRGTGGHRSSATGS